MNIILSILAIVLLLAGVIGCIVPIIPGVVLGYAGYLCCYFCSFSQISTTAVWVYLALAIVVTIADFILPAYMTKLSGGTKAGERGAIAGLIVGMLVGSLIGAILGPLFGAIVGELLADSTDTKRALKSGAASFLSFLLGTGIKLVLCIAMLWGVLAQIFPAVKDWFVNLF